jgi:predicted nucleic acid-binding protein
MPDEKDWWVLDLAYDSAADHIVTNDGHFLDRAERLRVYGFDVLTPEQLRAVVSPTP